MTGKHALSLGNGTNFKSIISKLILHINIMTISSEITRLLLPQNTIDDVNIDSSKSMVPTGNEPLPEPMVPHTYVT